LTVSPQAAAARSFAAARSRSALWLIDFPPLYVVTIALVMGDALGNAGV
jgi:hypothetical protein